MRCSAASLWKAKKPNPLDDLFGKPDKDTDGA
jgi:hypothetical protein